MNKVVIDATGLTCQFAHQTQALFHDLNVSLLDTCYFLVGQNGAGKSYLARKLAVASAEVKHYGSVGYLSQGLENFNGTVAEKLGIAKQLAALVRVEKGSVDPNDFELLDEKWDLQQILHKQLKAYALPVHILERSFNSLSGGQRTKLCLLALAREQHDFYILDEPSNHLDMAGREWLMSWVKAHPSCLIISHDMLLLEQSSIVLELSSRGLQCYRSGWEDYLASKRQERLGAERVLEKTEKTLKESMRVKQKNQEKFEKKESNAKKSRVDANQSKLILDSQKARHESTGSRLANVSEQRINTASKAYREAKETVEAHASQAFIISPIKKENKKPLLIKALQLPFGQTEAISLQLPYGERLWVSGNNGSGKSTLLNVLNGDIKTFVGEVDTPQSVAMLDQHFSFLDKEQSALNNFERLSPGLSEDKYRTILAQLRLRRDAALQCVNTLSGGECLKLALACVFSGKHTPALLLLDEPDNHLDLASKKLLIDALNQYVGSILVVSHDKHFISALGIKRQIVLSSPLNCATKV